MKDSKLSRALTWIIDIIFSGLLWCLFSLPVVTIGAASTALYYAAVKCIRHERGRLTQVFWKGFRDNFKCSTGIWLIYLAAVAVGTANVLAARQWSGGGLSPLTALAGAVFFINKGVIYPESGFSISWTVSAVFIGIIGGTGTVEGPVIGAVIYVLLQEFLAHYPGWSNIMLGVTTILVICFMPGGIARKIPDLVRGLKSLRGKKAGKA